MFNPSLTWKHNIRYNMHVTNVTTYKAKRKDFGALFEETVKIFIISYTCFHM